MIQQSMLLLALFMLGVAAERNLTFVPCSLPKPMFEDRRLFVITCETRLNDLFYLAWQTTGEKLRKSGIFMKNVCEGISWSGFLTKPLAYLDNVKRIKDVFSDNTKNYVMIMDADTFWSASDASDIWHKFDCARGKREMVVSSEMVCWIGLNCHITQVRKFYGIPGFYPSYSPFVNSGVIMGQLDLVLDMLEYTIPRNASYMQLHKEGYTFHDQFAVTDYAMKVAPHLVAVDYHQQLVGSYFVSAVDEPAVGSVCFDREGGLAYNCQPQTTMLYQKGHFLFDNVSCEAYRRVWQGMPVQLVVESLSPRPAIWHGNGRGKGLFQNMAKKMLKCLMRGNPEGQKVLEAALYLHRTGKVIQSAGTSLAITPAATSAKKKTDMKTTKAQSKSFFSSSKDKKKVKKAESKEKLSDDYVSKDSK